MIKIANSNGTAYRFQSDARQIGGLLMLMSFCCLIMPLTNISSAFGPDGAATRDPSTIMFWQIVGGLFVFIFGVTGVLTGYMAAVHDHSHKFLNIFLMVIIQSAWIGYITDMVAVSKAAGADPSVNGFIPIAYNPTNFDVRFVGAMGVIGILVYGFSFVGSMAFMVWSLHSYTTKNPSTRSGSYFRGRMQTYSAVLTVAGLVQFLLGCLCLARFDVNAENGPVGVAFFVVSFPAIAVFVGLLQILNGLWGLARSFGFGLLADTPMPVYQLSLAFQWLTVLVLQDIVQIAYLPGADKAPVTPFLACFSLGLTLMPAYLDHKANTMPETLPDDYYGERQTTIEENANEVEQTV